MTRRSLALVLIAGVAALIVRGVLPGLRQGQDFGPVYCASRLWARGLNPYDDGNLTVEAARAGITTPVGLPNFQSVYPPLALIGVWPLALMPYRTARAMLVVLNLVALAGCWWMLVRRFRWALVGERALALAAVVVSLAGVHTCLKDGQLTPIVLLGILVALRPGAGRLGGTLGWTLALMKFSIPGPYMVLAVLPRRRGDVVPVLLAGGIFVAAVAIVAAPLGLGTLIDSYRSSVGALFAPGARDDPATIGEGSATMLWVQALLYRVFSFAPNAVPTVSMAVTAAMACVLGLVLLRCREDGRVLLVIAAFVLLASYHRVYDSVLLLPGVAWLIDRDWRRYERGYLLLTFLLLPFLVPGPAILQTLLPDTLHHRWAVYAVVVPHQTWCLLAILVVASLGVVDEVLAPVGRARRQALQALAG